MNEKIEGYTNSNGILKLNKKETAILDMLVSGAKVRTIKDTLKCGAEIIKRIRTEFQEIYPQIKIKKGTRTRTRTGTLIYTHKDKKEIIGQLLDREEILFLEKMRNRMGRHRSIHKDEEPLFDSILNKLKNF